MGAVGVGGSWEYRSDVITYDTACKSAHAVCGREAMRRRKKRAATYTYTDTSSLSFLISVVDKCSVNFAH